MAPTSGRMGLLLALKGLLRAAGIPREQIAEDIVEYQQLSDEELEATIRRLQEVLRPLGADEGSSQDPHAGRAHRTPLPEPADATQQALDTTQPPPDGVVTQEDHATRVPSRQVRRCTSTTPTPSASGSHLSAMPSPGSSSQHQGLFRTCVGSYGVTCDIDIDGRVVPIGGGRLFRQRIGQLLELYMPRLHVLWPDQLELDKKFVIAQLEREFGVGWRHKQVLKEMATLLRHRRNNARRYAMVPENKRPAGFNEESWTHFRREMRFRVEYKQQKEAAQARVGSGHTSHLGRMDKHGFIATFIKDYGRAPTAAEIELATYQGYKALQRTLPLARTFEVLGETNIELVARKEEQGRRIHEERTHTTASPQQAPPHTQIEQDDDSNTD
ncbi:hypothetical protein L7F22_059365 [Adiantum nelumboides]|nr:hypothetical protein [Adiantum nelumboides]